MKFVSALTEADRAALEEVHHDAKAHRQRQRAHAVLLSSQGFTLEQLEAILRADRDTISGWLDAWQEKGLDGLADAPKSGRRRKIDGHLEAVLRDILIENPSPNMILIENPSPNMILIENPSPNMKALLQDEIKKRAL